MKITTKEINLEEAKKLGIDDWATWDCEPSQFDWQYSSTEIAYVFEGDVHVTTDEGDIVQILPGMLVTFPKGMKCNWKVNKTIKKAYTFE